MVFKKKKEIEDYDEYENDDDEYTDEELEQEEKARMPTPKKTAVAKKTFKKKQNTDKYSMIYQQTRAGILDNETEEVKELDLANLNMAILLELVEIKNELDKIKKAVI